MRTVFLSSGKASSSLVETHHLRPTWRRKMAVFSKCNHTDSELASERLMRFQHFPHSAAHLSPPPPRAKAAGPGRAAQAAIDSKSLAAKQTKGSSIILTVLALRPPPPGLLSSTHLWRSPVKRKLWGRHGALCTAGLAPLLRGRGPGLIGGSTGEHSSSQAAQLGGAPFASM